MTRSELFGTPSTLPSGFSHYPSFLASDEEADLLRQFATFDWQTVRFRGQVARRRGAYFGFSYVATGRSLAPAPPPSGPLAALWRRCEEFAGTPLDQAIVWRYPPGAGIGWHTDADVFGEPIVGVALKGECRMRFRRRSPTNGAAHVECRIEPRSIYFIRGEARWSWEHAIPAVAEERFSVTFRTVRQSEQRRVLPVLAGPAGADAGQHAEPAQPAPVALKRDAAPDPQPDDAGLNRRLLDHGAGVEWRYRDIQADLQTWVRRFDAAFFDARLPPPAISIGPARRALLGSYHPGRDAMALRHHVHINAKHLGRPKADVLATLLHELVHLWEEVERGRGPVAGNYHTRAFCDHAAALGIPAKRRTGHSLPVPPDGPFARLLAAHGVPLDGPSFVSLSATEGAVANRSRSSIQPWTCGCTRVWAARGVDLDASCSRCGRSFVRAAARRR